MKFVFLAACLLFGSASQAAEVEALVENFERTSTGAAEVVMRFTNNTNRSVAYAGANCALLDKNGRALTTVSIVAQNIAPKARGFGKAYGPQDPRVEKAECRLTGVDFAD